MDTVDSIDDEVLQTMKIGQLIGINMEGQEDNIRKMISEEEAQVTMPSTSRSKLKSKSKLTRRKCRKCKFVPKPKQRWQVKQPTRNWLDLPSDVMANIIKRIGVFDILENAQNVCTAWRKICKDPAMWRVIYMDNLWDPCGRPPCREMCKNVVDRSQGQLVDLTIIDFCDDELLQYVANRAGQLRRLVIASCYGDLYETWPEVLIKFPLLEELGIYTTDVSKEAIETAARYCPLLKTLKLNDRAHTLWDGADDEESLTIRNEIAVTIGKNLRELRHLELIGNSMTNIGLQAILDGCCHLESLDLRRCMYIALNGDIGKRCREQIKSLKLPKDSLDGCPFIYENDSDACEVACLSDDSDDGYHGYFDYDDDNDFTAYDDEDEDDDYEARVDDFCELVLLNEMMAFMDTVE